MALLTIATAYLTRGSPFSLSLSRLPRVLPVVFIMIPFGIVAGAYGIVQNADSCSCWWEKVFDLVPPRDIWEVQTLYILPCDHIGWPGTTCDQIGISCDHMGALRFTCDHIGSLVITLGHLGLLVITRSPGTTCDHNWTTQDQIRMIIPWVGIVYSCICSGKWLTGIAVQLFSWFIS